MIKNYIKIAFRNLLRNKLFSLLNITGLVIGMVASLLILQYVHFEKSYDSFFHQTENIYRVANYYENEVSSTTFLNTGNHLVKDFSEVQQATSILFGDNGLVAYEDKRFNEKNFYFVESSFFEVFSFTLLKGKRATALREPFSMVLTESMAKKYFGNQNPLGQSITYNGKTKYKITGVVQNPPPNSHLKFNFLATNHDIQKVLKNRKRDWSWANFYTYIVAKPGTKPKELEAKFPAFLTKYLPTNKVSKLQLHLQPLADIYLSYTPGLSPKGDAQAINLLLTIALLILLIAWINYVNLATARAVDRAKEVGLRKVMGAYRKQLVFQFLGEAFFINLLACLFTILLADLLAPLLVSFTGVPMHLDMWLSVDFWSIFAAVFLLGVLFSGLYPAFILSSFKPVKVLKGKVARSPQGISLRKGLILTQFTIAILLIGGTITIDQQLKYMHNQSLGIDIAQTLVVSSPRTTSSTQKINALKQEVLQMAQVQNFSTSASVPGHFGGLVNGVKLKGQDGKGISQQQFWIDDRYLPTYGLKLIAGRNFSGQRKAENKKSIVINASAAKAFGYTPKEIINKKLKYSLDKQNNEYKIIGVVNNFHQRSLKEAVNPTIFRYRHEGLDYYSIKLNTADIPTAVAAIKKAYLQLFPQDTFEYYFLDVAYNAQYQADEKFGQMFSLFSGLGILVACIGLFGLASFTLLQRTKELGIRKVLGASANSLLLLLLRDFLKPVVLAGILAFPLMYWGVTKWLQNFAYHIQPGWWLFVLPLLIVSLVALFTVSFQALKATRNNPIDSLRYE